MKRTGFRRKPRKALKKATRRVLRAGTIHRAINPATGKILGVKGAKERAWKAVSRYVRSIEPRCCTCGEPTTEAGHYFHNSDKGNKQLGGNELWYDIRNIHGQCSTCNRWKSGNLAAYTMFLEDRYGPGIVQELNRLFRTPKKWTIPEILAVEEKYQKDTVVNLSTSS